MSDWEKQVVLVTGAARGIGAQVARRLVAAGARVVIGDLLAEQGRALAAELGDRAAFVRQDVSSESDWAEAIGLAEAMDNLTGLVNNAGISLPGRLAETEIGTFEAQIRVNQIGCFLGMKAAIAPMRRAGRGSIVNLSSVAGLRGMPAAFAYSATKWAVRGMTKAAAIDLAPLNIRVNSVHPGLTETDMVAGLSPELRQQRLENVPLRRFGAPDEVARTILHLLSNDSAYVSGAEIAVDGGWTA